MESTTTAQEQPGVFADLIATYDAERHGHGLTAEPAEHERYLLAMLDPDQCDRLHHFPARTEGGLVLHRDGVWEENVARIADAEHSVGEDCGYRVHAVEHHDGDLWYRTFPPTPTR